MEHSVTTPWSLVSSVSKLGRPGRDVAAAARNCAEARGTGGDTPLHAAASTGRERVVERLLMKQAAAL